MAKDKDSDLIKEIIKKYDLALPLTRMEKWRILRAKRRTLASILSAGEGAKFRYRWSLGFYSLMKRAGLDVSPAAGVNAAFASAALALVIIVSGSFLVIQDRISFTGAGEIAGRAEIQRCVTTGGVSAATTADAGSADICRSAAAGDEIVTGDGAAVLMQLGNGVTISLLRNSRFRITAEGPVYLSGGCVVSSVPSPFNGVYSVETPGATVRVTGTLFSVSYYNGKTSVAVMRGGVLIKDKTSGNEFTLEQGRFAEISGVIDTRGVTESEKSFLEEAGALSEKDAPGEADLSELDRKYSSIEKPDSAHKKQTLEDIREKYGRIDEVVLYSGRRYTGAVISRGENLKLMTVNGVVTVSAKNVKNIIPR